MTGAPAAAAHETPLIERHRALGARLIEFAGWLMPVQYGGIIEEHRAVRERAGLFDLSHMGELFVEGPEAGDGLAAALVTDPPALAIGRAHYSMICDGDGGVLDDLIVYRLAEERFLVVANASNAGVVSDALAERLTGFRAVLDDRSLATVLVAIQGPRSSAILDPLTELELDGLRYYAIAEGHVAGIPALVARTGYTGEDGFEIYMPAEAARGIWRAILEAGSRAGIVPCGLGARDTLRLEARMLLYGNDMDETTTVLEADLGWIVKLGKGLFLGRELLERQKREGVARKLVGFEMEGRAIARHGYPAWADGRPVGQVTSGTFAPFLKKSIGLVYLPRGLWEPGTRFEVEVRGRREGAVVVPTPFYKRAR